MSDHFIVEPPEKLRLLTFLAGYWRCEREGGALEEVWLAPSAGVAQGSVRFVEAGVVRTIELIVVTAEPDRVVMRYNHFHPDYRTWETDGPIELTLISARPNEAIFANLSAQPRHALEMGYRITSADTMESWVVVVLADGGAEKLSFEFRRSAI